MGHSITYPTEITYWIVYDNIPDELVGYGELNTEQVLSTGRKYLWYTLDKIEFENKLLTFRLKPFLQTPEFGLVKNISSSKK